MAETEQAQALDSFIDIDTSNVPEPKVLPEGEARIRLKSCEQKLSRVKEDGSGGNPMVVCQYVIPSEPQVEDLYFYVNIPTPSMEEKAQIRAARGLANWKEAHGLDQKGKIDLIGLGNSGIEVYAHLGIEEYQGEKRNRIQKFIRKAS